MTVEQKVCWCEYQHCIKTKNTEGTYLTRPWFIRRTQDSRKIARTPGVSHCRSRSRVGCKDYGSVHWCFRRILKGKKAPESQASPSCNTRLLCTPGEWFDWTSPSDGHTESDNFQINLIVGDFFKSTSTLIPTSASTDKLITWLRSKSQVLALLCDKCRDLKLHTSSIIQAVITRWTAHYLAYKRLLELQWALQTLKIEDLCRPPGASVFVKGPAASKRKATAMVELIGNHKFWRNLAS